MKSVKEQIRRIRVIRDRFWTWRRSRRRKSTVRSRRRRSTLRPAWKAILSEARVTRDEVSGLKPRRGDLSGRQYQADKNRADKISIDKNKEKTEKNIFLYFYLLIFLYHYKQWNPQPRQRDFSLFTLHSSLFTKKTSGTVHANKKVRENAKIV